MRRPAVLLALFLACCTAACSLRRQVTLPSPYCRGGGALAYNLVVQFTGGIEVQLDETAMSPPS